MVVALDSNSSLTKCVSLNSSVACSFSLLSWELSKISNTRLIISFSALRHIWYCSGRCSVTYSSMDSLEIPHKVTLYLRLLILLSFGFCFFLFCALLVSLPIKPFRTNVLPPRVVDLLPSSSFFSCMIVTFPSAICSLGRINKNIDFNLPSGGIRTFGSDPPASTLSTMYITLVL